MENCCPKLMWSKLLGVNATKKDTSAQSQPSVPGVEQSQKSQLEIPSEPPTPREMKMDPINEEESISDGEKIPAVTGSVVLVEKDDYVHVN